MINKILLNKSNFVFYTFLFSGISIVSFFLYQNKLAKEYSKIHQDLGSLLVQFYPVAEHDIFWYRLPIIMIGIAGITYGYLALINGKRIGVFGIIISTIAITLTFAPKFLIWY